MMSGFPASKRIPSRFSTHPMQIRAIAVWQASSPSLCWVSYSIVFGLPIIPWVETSRPCSARKRFGEGRGSTVPARNLPHSRRFGKWDPRPFPRFPTSPSPKPIASKIFLPEALTRPVGSVKYPTIGRGTTHRLAWPEAEAARFPIYIEPTSSKDAASSARTGNIYPTIHRQYFGHGGRHRRSAGLHGIALG
jgi:hypothetical protein